MSSPGFTIGDYRSYRRWHYRSYRKGAIGLSGTIGVLSEFTIGLSDRGSGEKQKGGRVVADREHSVLSIVV